MKIEEMIALIDADLETNGDITDTRIAELHTVINTAPMEELLPKEVSPTGKWVIAIADKIRAEARKKGLRGKAAETYFYDKLLEQI